MLSAVPTILAPKVVNNPAGMEVLKNQLAPVAHAAAQKTIADGVHRAQKAAQPSQPQSQSDIGGVDSVVDSKAWRNAESRGKNLNSGTKNKYSNPSKFIDPEDAKDLETQINQKASKRNAMGVWANGFNAIAGMENAGQVPYAKGITGTLQTIASAVPFAGDSLYRFTLRDWDKSVRNRKKTANRTFSLYV